MKKWFKGLVLLTLLAGFFYCSSNYVEYKEMYLRHKVGSQVVKITNKEENSGGTGFHIKTNSENVYILTNAHICDGVGKDGILWVTSGNSNKIPRKIIESNDYTDLCLVEPLPNQKGLTLREDIQEPVNAYSFGHPNLMPLTMNKGEVTGREPVEIVVKLGHDECDKPKFKKTTIPWIFGDMPACSLILDAYMSNIIALPGSSGSPVVDSSGNLFGVVFAGNRANWAFIITQLQISKFLKAY
jgi:hypothetical protein